MKLSAGPGPARHGTGHYIDNRSPGLWLLAWLGSARAEVCQFLNSISNIVLNFFVATFLPISSFHKMSIQSTYHKSFHITKFTFRCNVFGLEGPTSYKIQIKFNYRHLYHFHWKLYHPEGIRSESSLNCSQKC